MARASSLARSPLLAHQLAEADLVDLEPLLLRHLEGQVDREAVGVVQREAALAAEPVPPACLHLGGRLVEDRGAGAQGLPERVLLGVGDLRDALPVAVQVGVRLAHLVAAHRAAARGARGPRSPAGASSAPRGAAAGAGRSRGPRCPGVTPSPISIIELRTWSATTRNRTSSSWSAP